MSIGKVIKILDSLAHVVSLVFANLCRFFSAVCVCLCVLTPTLCHPIVARQTPLSMGFSRQEYWSRLPFHSPGDLPNPGIKPVSPLFSAFAGGFFTTAPPGKYFCLVLT